MSNKYSENLNNGLRISVDYMAFTITDDRFDVDDVIDMMGFEPEDFVLLPRGGFGYKKQRKNEKSGISVLYDGSENMGIHVNITGKGVPFLLESFYETLPKTEFGGQIYSWMSEDVLSQFFQTVLQYGHFSRVDVAIDDEGGQYFSPPEIFKIYKSNQIVSKWRSVRRVDRYKAPNDCNGYTVYFGSRESMLMLRLYDKALEINNNFAPGEDGYIDHNWYRWELEYKEDRANEFAKAIIDGANLGSIAVGVLAYYIRLINLDDSNRSRCSTMEKWEKFVHDIEALRLSGEKKKKTVYDKLMWVDSQVAPTLATLLLLYNFDQNFLYDIAIKNKDRISKSDWELIREHRPELFDYYSPYAAADK